MAGEECCLTVCREGQRQTLRWLWDDLGLVARLLPPGLKSTAGVHCNNTAKVSVDWRILVTLIVHGTPS